MIDKSARKYYLFGKWLLIFNIVFVLLFALPQDRFSWWSVLSIICAILLMIQNRHAK